MKREHRLRYIIKEGILDTFFIWKDELKNVFKDSGVMIFFFLVPFIYPLLYAFIYNNEVVHNAKMVVVDQSDSYLSREYIRKVDATADVKVVAVCSDMEEAKRMMDAKEAYGIGLIVIFSCSIVDDGLFCARSSFPISSETSVVANRKAL